MGRPKGYPKYGGRAKGTPNKVTAALKDMIRGALDEAGGQAYLVQQARDNPNAFLGLVARIVPREIVGELKISRIEVVRQLDAPGTLVRVEGGDSAAREVAAEVVEDDE